MRRNVINFVLFQVVWFVTVLGAAKGYDLLGAAVLIAIIPLHIWFVGFKRGDALLLPAALLIGFSVDTCLHLMAAIRFPLEPTLMLTQPVWMAVLWVNFALTLRHSLAWVMEKPVPAIILGAVGGPLAYGFGHRIGAIEIPAPLIWNAVLTGALWAAAMFGFCEFLRRNVTEPKSADHAKRVVALLTIASLIMVACSHQNTEQAQEADDMLKVGDTAPDFEFTDLEGTTRLLSDLLTEGPVVVYFYPADFTRVCTQQACMVRDRTEELRDAGVYVLGISPQDTDSHARFQEEYELSFPLVADTEKRIIKAYGVNGPLGIGVRRATFLVNQDGTIGEAVQANISVAPHSGLIDRAIQINSDEQSG